MYNDIHIGVITIGYILYIVILNWVYIKEYTQSKGVIRRGMEWD